MTDIWNTEDSLGIFWEGEEVSGITAYGYFKGAVERDPNFPLQLWPRSTSFKMRSLYGEGWKVYLWDIRITVWPPPEEWEETIKGTLEAMIEVGARIAWCGLEGHFADPPSLFEPAEMSGGVYAVVTRELGFQCTAQLGRPFQSLPDEYLIKLRKLV